MAAQHHPQSGFVVARLGGMVGRERRRPRRPAADGQRCASSVVRRARNLHSHLGPISLNGSSVVGCPSTHDARRVISDSTIEELADELWMADRKAAPIQALTARYPDLVIEDAYAIQSHNTERRIQMGALIIGRKVGLTSKPMQQLLGVDEPDYGVLFDDMVVEDGDTIALSSLVQPRVEAEMAFLMETDLVGPGVTTARALAAIAGVLPSIEVVDSRVADWKIKLVDTVADNASSGLFVMGGNLRPVT